MTTSLAQSITQLSHERFPLNSNSGISISLHHPTLSDVEQITNCINVAYIEKEGWFKREEYKHRTTVPEIEAIISRQLDQNDACNSGFLVLRKSSSLSSSNEADNEAEQSEKGENGNGSEENESCDGESGEMVGVVYLDAHGEDEDSLYFGMLACERKFVGSGFGTTLLNQILPLVAKGAGCRWITCKVASVSLPLLNWYLTKCHFVEVGAVEWDKEILHMLNQPAHFICIRKEAP